MPISAMHRPRSHRRLTGLVALLALGMSAARAQAGIPRQFQGAWAIGGHCNVPKNRLVITAQTAALGQEKPQPIVFFPNDSPDGQGALHWAEEGNVDNFVPTQDGTGMVHNTEGYGMGTQILYARCAK